MVELPPRDAGSKAGVGRRPVADPLAHLGGVRLRQQAIHGIPDEVRIAEVGVAVGERLPHRFGLPMEQRG